MLNNTKRLTILSKAEYSALYALPDFDHQQRMDYLTLTDQEKRLALSYPYLQDKVYCILQIGYFKAKQIFFRFSWEEVAKEDILFVLQHYFPKQLFRQQPISKRSYYAQCHAISKLFEYQLWSKIFVPILSEKTFQIILKDINPQFIVIELLSFLQSKKIVRPRYTILQDVISNALTSERKRLTMLINNTLNEETKSSLQVLLLEDETLSKLAAIKQDAKDFKLRMMAAEREKLATLKPIYSEAKKILPLLKLTKQNIYYYASLIDYYTIYDLRKKLKSEQIYLYLLCYIWQRYQQLNDNLMDSFCYHLKQFNAEMKEKAKEAFYQQQRQEQRDQIIMRQLAELYLDERLPDDLLFGEVRQQAFLILPKQALREKLFNPNKKPISEMGFRWEMTDKLAKRFKLYLRPLMMAIDFSSVTPSNPWLAAVQWLKNIFSEHKSLSQCTFNECPEGTLPKRLRYFLLETNHENQMTKLRAERYEFWIYRQIQKYVDAGELYLEDSIYHQSLNQEMVSLSEKDTVLKQLDIPALRQPIEKQLDERLAELHELWHAFNQDLKSGKLNHLHYDKKSNTLSLVKPALKKDEEFKNRFYEQLPICDIVDVIRFVNERCQFLSAFTNILPRYTKQKADERSLMAVIMAQAMNQSHLNMAAMCDIPYYVLKETLQAHVRLPTLKNAHDMIANDIASMSIFPFYSFDLEILYGSVDGQKFESESPTIQARYSRKYFKKGRGVVAYTLLSNHIPLQVELIGAHEHESYFTFDLWYNNTSTIIPDVVTGDMHCINKANFALMDWFGAKLFPRFTDIEAQQKHLYSGNDPAEYKNFLIQPIGQINRQLIEADWSNLQRIIATLGLKEISQSILIKKLCTYTQNNPTRKALFEYDKLIRSIHTLKYLRDPHVQRDTHRSQNRVESYHSERAAIAQAYGKKQLTGKTDIAIAISNQCGRLLATIINHYNSAILSKLRDKYEATGNKKGLAMLKKISPIAWDHIHFQGHLVFSDDSQILDIDSIIDKLVLK